MDTDDRKMSMPDDFVVGRIEDLSEHVGVSRVESVAQNLAYMERVRQKNIEDARWQSISQTLDMIFEMLSKTYLILSMTAPKEVMDQVYETFDKIVESTKIEKK